MVRPYLPRFLREGDRAELKVVVNNAGERRPERHAWTSSSSIPTPDEDLRADFGLSTSATTGVPFTVDGRRRRRPGLPLRRRPASGPWSVTVIARAGDLADGEQRPCRSCPAACT